MTDSVKGKNHDVQADIEAKMVVETSPDFLEKLCAKVKEIIIDSPNGIDLANKELLRTFREAHDLLLGALIQNPAALRDVNAQLSDNADNTNDSYREYLVICLINEIFEMPQGALSQAALEILQSIHPDEDEGFCQNIISDAQITYKEKVTEKIVGEMPSIDKVTSWAELLEQARMRVQALGMGECNVDGQDFEANCFTRVHCALIGKSCDDINDAENPLEFWMNCPADFTNGIMVGADLVEKKLCAEFQDEFEKNKPIDRADCFEKLKDAAPCLALMATRGLTPHHYHGKILAEVTDPGKWTGQDRMKIVELLVSQGKLSFLSLFNLEELPLDGQKKYRSLFYEVYKKCKPAVLVGHPELFEENILTDATQQTAAEKLSLLEETEEPKDDILEEITRFNEFSAKKMAENFLRNHSRLLAKIARIGFEKIPFIGLHAVTKNAGDSKKMLEDPLALPQVVTVLNKPFDENSMLIDLYDMVGGCKRYMKHELMVFDVEKGNGKSICHRWADGGKVSEFKNWHMDSRFFAKIFAELNLKLSPAVIQTLEYFRRSNVYKDEKAEYREPHAEKSDLSGEHEERVIVIIPAEEIPLNLLHQGPYKEGSEKYNQATIAEMIFVQTIAGKILDSIMQSGKYT